MNDSKIPSMLPYGALGNVDKVIGFLEVADKAKLSNDEQVSVCDAVSLVADKM